MPTFSGLLELDSEINAARYCSTILATMIKPCWPNKVEVDKVRYHIAGKHPSPVSIPFWRHSAPTRSAGGVLCEACVLFSTPARTDRGYQESDLFSSLWASCDELRGGMDASQYKD